MREQAAAQLRLAVESFAGRDPARAKALIDMDDVMDELQKSLFQAIFANHAHDDVALQRAVQIALVGRFYERIGDHAANVAERVGDRAGPPVARREGLGLAVLAVAVAGAASVDDPPRRQPEPRRRLGVAGRAPAELFAGRVQLFGPRGPVDGTVDAATAGETL